MHQEKIPHFNKQLRPGLLKADIKLSRSFGPFCPWFFTLRLIYSQQCQILSVTECGCQRPTSKPKIKSMRPLTSQLGHVIERYVESDTWAQMGKKRQFLTFLPVRSSRTDHSHPDLVVWLDIGKCTKKKFHISINTSPRAAQSWHQPISKFWAFLPVILHFATKLFTAVPNFRRHWMRVPAAYKQTKNQLNATTHITAGSCYREVRWKWHVGTNGQKATISHLSARSKLKNWPSPPWSRCLAGHREVNQEKIPHFNKHFAQGCSKLTSTDLEVLGLFARDSSLCD